MIGISTGYTPFNETSFGYAATEIGSNYTTTGDVTVTITHTGGNFDATGHISTPTSGDASAIFDKTTEVWSATGSVAEVDAILAALLFFPADKSTVRTWTPTLLKTNVTTGNYGTSEHPPTIGATTFSAVLSDATGTVASETITFTPVEVQYDNERPYFSVEPPTTTSLTKNLASGTKQALNLGTIDHGSDTENVRVYGQFHDYPTGLIIDEYSGSIASTSDKYVGNKLPDTPDPTNPVTSSTASFNTRFDFTGTVPEAQAFLDSIEYINYGTGGETFNLWVFVTDGQTGSEVKTVCHFPQSLTMTAFPDQTTTEDDAAFYFTNATGLTLSGFGGLEADEWYATFTIDSTGTPGIHGVIGGTLSGSVFTTTTYSTFSALMSAMSSTGIELDEDFNTDFSIDVQIHGANTTLGTSYTMAAPQTFNVSIPDDAEVSNPITSHTYTEDTVYYFNTGGVGTYPQIIHGRNSNFTVVFTHPTSVGAPAMWRDGSSGTISNTSTTFTISGTRDDVNTALQNLYYAPATDFNGNHTITFTVDRTSGDLSHHTTTNGQLIMTGVAVSEVSQTSQANIDWEEDVYKDFDSQLVITDTAADDSKLPATGSTYTLTARGKYMDDSVNPAVSTALTTVQWDTNVTSYTSKTGTGTVADPLIIVGTKAQINAALADLKMKADVDFFYAQNTNGDFLIEYNIVRDSDNTTLTNYTLNTTFNAAIGNGYTWTNTPYTNHIVSWTEEIPQTFDLGLTITDKADENSDYAQYGSDYKATLYLSIWDISANNYADFTGLTLSTTTTTGITTGGSGTTADPYTIQGSKANVNTALENMKITPDPDFTNTSQVVSPAGGSWVYGQLTRVQDNKDFVSNLFNQWYNAINPGTPADEYSAGTAMTYTEDIATQYIFAGKGFGIIDNAEDVLSGVTYDVTVRMEPTSAGSLNSGVHSVNITGTKSYVNAQIELISFTPAPDTNDTIDIYYTQDRYVSGTLDVNHITDTDIADVTAVPVTEYTYGTGNSNIQYFVLDSSAPVTPGQILSPKNLTENWSKAYSTPINITDIYEDGGGASEYKIEFTGNPGGTTLYDNTDTSFAGTLDWDTKANIHTKLSEGIRVSGATSSFTLSFTLYRKTSDGTEKTLDTGSLSYVYLNESTTVVNYNMDDYMSYPVTNNSTVYGISESTHTTADYTIIPTSTLITATMDTVHSYMTVSTTSGSPQGHGTGISVTLDASRTQPIGVATFDNSAIHTSNLTLTSDWGTKTTMSVAFNMTSVGTSDQSNYGNIIPFISDVSVRKTTEYWDGTYTIPQYRAMQLDGSMSGSGADISQRYEAQFGNSDDSVLGGFHRCIMSGDQGYFYAFRLMRDGTYGSNTGDVTIEMFTQTTPGGTWMPGSGNDMPSATIKSGYSNLYTSPDYETHCSIHDVKYDSANNDIYVLSILNVSGVAAYANIYKLHYDGVASGLGSHTSYAWSLVKDFQILTSSENYYLEAYLSNDCNSVVMMQTDSSNPSSSRLRVYDKDQGGTDNWGLAVTQNYTASTYFAAYNTTQTPYGTVKEGFWHDQRYCAYNGVDTFITSDGYKVFQKNQGGTNAWGENTTLSSNLYCYVADWLPLAQNHGTFGFTQNYLFFAGNKGVQIFNKSTFVPLTSGYASNDNFTDDYNNADYPNGYTTSNHNVRPTLDTSLLHDIVTVTHHNEDGMDSPAASKELLYKIYELIT